MSFIVGPPKARPNLQDRAKVHWECDPSECGDAGVAEYALELEAAIKKIIGLPQKGAWLKRDGEIYEIACSAIRRKIVRREPKDDTPIEGEPFAGGKICE